MNPIERILGKKLVKDKWSRNLAMSAKFGEGDRVFFKVNYQGIPSGTVGTVEAVAVQNGTNIYQLKIKMDSSTAMKIKEPDYFSVTVPEAAIMQA